MFFVISQFIKLLKLLIRKKSMSSTQIVTITAVSTDAQNNVVASYADPAVSVILAPSVTSKYMPVIGDDLIIETADDGTVTYTVAPPAAAAVVETAPTTVTLTNALTIIADGQPDTTFTGVTFASGVTVSVADLTSPVTLNFAPVVA